jgi:hypothetical protein
MTIGPRFDGFRPMAAVAEPCSALIGFFADSNSHYHGASEEMVNHTLSLTRIRRPSNRAFDHILIIMFENQYRGYVLGNPYMRRLARQGIQFGNYFGVVHPSQTNYIAAIAGELCNVTNDEQPPLLAQRTIVDLIEEAPGRLRWKAYMESYVPNAAPWTRDFSPKDGPPYFVKHNPFSSFSSIVRSDTIEQNFSLGHLSKNDAGSNWFQFLWHRRFEWSAPLETPLEPGEGPIAAAGFAGALFVASAAPDGSVCLRTRSSDHGHWSAKETLAVDGSGGLTMASSFTELVLVARSASGNVSCMKYDLLHGWSKETSPATGPVLEVALASFARETKIMFAQRTASGAVATRVRGDDGKGTIWGKSVPVEAARSDGAITLGALGESLYLLVKTPEYNSINVVSYNSAPFNAVTVKRNRYGGPQDNTTVDFWSPSAFPVAHFSAWPDASGKRQPYVRPYETSGPMAVATLDGVMHLVHPGVGNLLLLTETFSISGVMTPAKPVSYKNAAVDVNNGFGTLAEAGWSKQSPLFDTRCERGGALAMGRAGDQILLLYRAKPGSLVQLLVGQYVQKDV